MEIWHEETAREFREKFKQSAFNLEERLDISHLRQTLNQLKNWPLLEALAISEHGLKEPISRVNKTRLEDLKDTMLSFIDSELRDAFSLDLADGYSFKVVRPDEKDYVMKAMDRIATCYRNLNTNEIMMRFLQDIELGGTIMYLLEKDEQPVVYNKLFLSRSQVGSNALFYDCIENGNVQASKIKHWNTVSRTHELAYSIAFAVHMAKQLDVASIGLGDRELDEAGEVMGCKRSYLLPHSYRKVGYAAHPKNKGEVIYANRLYKTANNKHRTMQVTHVRRGTQLTEEFNQVYGMLERSGFNPIARHFKNRMHYLRLCSQLVSFMNSGSSEMRAKMNEQMRRVEIAYSK